MTGSARLVFAVAIIACAPADVDETAIGADVVDRYLAARCGAMFRCDCPATGQIDRAMCEAEGRARYDAPFAELRAQAAVLDADCFAEVIDWWESPAACERSLAAPYCVLSRGAGARGDACVSAVGRSFTASTCGDDLRCRAGKCATPTEPVVLGDGTVCRDRAPEAVCADGLFCDAQSGVCTAPAQAGATCAQSDACEDDAWCDLGGGTCVVRVDVGDSCASSPWDPHPCLRASDGASSYCVDGRCLAPVAHACGPWL